MQTVTLDNGVEMPVLGVADLIPALQARSRPHQHPKV
jgi:hypothetical protein